jgi:hypothetical protein
MTGYEGDVPDEIVFRPLERSPVIMRWNFDIEEMTITDATRLLTPNANPALRTIGSFSSFFELHLIAFRGPACER